MLKPPCFSLENLDYADVCGNVWQKWSCVFTVNEMDMSPPKWGRGNAGEFKNKGFARQYVQSGKTPYYLAKVNNSAKLLSRH